MNSNIRVEMCTCEPTCDASCVYARKKEDTACSYSDIKINDEHAASPIKIREEIEDSPFNSERLPENYNAYGNSNIKVKMSTCEPTCDASCVYIRKKEDTALPVKMKEEIEDSPFSSESVPENCNAYRNSNIIVEMSSCEPTCDASCVHTRKKENTACSYSDIKIKNEDATSPVEIKGEVEDSFFISESEREESCSIESEAHCSKIRINSEQDPRRTEFKVVCNNLDSSSEIKIEGRDVISSDKSEGAVEQYDFSLNLPEGYEQTYNSYINELVARASVPIIKSVSNEFINNFQHFNTRYYEDKYCINFNVTDVGYLDILIRIHTNKLLLVALASGNDIVQNNRDILYINFFINNSDRSNLQLKGKKKRGSKAIEPQTILCQVKLKNDSKVYNIRAGIYGRLLEINEHIKTNPNLIRTDPKGLGFIAVLTPRGQPQQYEDNINKLDLLSENEYFKHILERPKRPSSN